MQLHKQLLPHSADLSEAIFQVRIGNLMMDGCANENSRQHSVNKHADLLDDVIHSFGSNSPKSGCFCLMITFENERSGQD